MISPDNTKMIEGIKCYQPEVAEDYLGYPNAGFEITDELEDESFWVQSRNRLLKREVLRTVSGVAYPCFLEIGCGTGTFLRSLSSEKTLSLVGSEIYLRGLRSARKRSSSKIEFIQLDATRIPFSNKFDTIGAFDVIEHIEDDVAVLSGIQRSLKSEGYLIVTVPQHQFLWSNLDEFVHHKRRYNRQDLLEKIESVGLKIEYVSSFVFSLFPLMLISRYLEKNKEVSMSNFDQQVRFNHFTNWFLGFFMRIDEIMIRLRLSLPWGGSLIVVAKKLSDN